MLRLITATILMLASLQASAGVFRFDLADSEFGNERPPTYGLRLDGLYSGNAGDVYTFSFVDVQMVVDSVAGTVDISGDLLGGSEGDGEARDTDWALSFTYTGMDVDAADGSWEFTNGVSGGTGLLTNIATSDVFELEEFMGSDGFGPDGDGVDCRGTDGPWCGNGWLNHSITPGASVAGVPHLNASDFLYVGTPVPAPPVAILFALGLAGLGYGRKRLG